MVFGGGKSPETHQTCLDITYYSRHTLLVHDSVVFLTSWKSFCKGGGLRKSLLPYGTLLGNAANRYDSRPWPLYRNKRSGKTAKPSRLSQSPLLFFSSTIFPLLFSILIMGKLFPVTLLPPSPPPPKKKNEIKILCQPQPDQSWKELRKKWHFKSIQSGNITLILKEFLGDFLRFPMLYNIWESFFSSEERKEVNFFSRKGKSKKQMISFSAWNLPVFSPTDIFLFRSRGGVEKKSLKWQEIFCVTFKGCRLHAH